MTKLPFDLPPAELIKSTDYDGSLRSLIADERCSDPTNWADITSTAARPGELKGQGQTAGTTSRWFRRRRRDR